MSADKWMKDVVEGAAAGIEMTVREDGEFLIVEKDHGHWYFDNTNEGANQALEAIASVATDPLSK